MSDSDSSYNINNPGKNKDETSSIYTEEISSEYTKKSGKTSKSNIKLPKSSDKVWVLYINGIP